MIIVSDATADPLFTFADFRRALRFAESDLHVEISLDDQEKLHDLMPDDGRQTGSPMAEANKGYLCAKIRYNSRKQGRLIYLKSTMIGGQRIRTKSYKLEYPRFPNQPTSDQFIDEAQFAAYRDLGYTIALDMLENCDLKPLNLRLGQDRRSAQDRRLAMATTTQAERRRTTRRATKDRRVA